jgi:hypothetical protein
VSGVAISDRRLVSHEGGRVAFRWKNYRSGGAEATTSLAGVEFVRRYVSHVLPRGLVRIRYYGLLSNRCRRVELVRCRALLGMKVVALADGVRSSSALELEEVKLVSSSDSPRCPQCGGSGLVVVELGPSLCAERSRSAAVLRKHGVGQTFEEFMSRQRKGAIAASGRGNHNVDSS